MIGLYKEELVACIQKAVWLGLLKQYKEEFNGQMREVAEVKMEDWNISLKILNVKIYWNGRQLFKIGRLIEIKLIGVTKLRGANFHCFISFMLSYTKK